MPTQRCVPPDDLTCDKFTHRETGHETNFYLSNAYKPYVCDTSHQAHNVESTPNQP